jgi:hypothetical protein
VKPGLRQNASCNCARLAQKILSASLKPGKIREIDLARAQLWFECKQPVRCQLNAV